MALIILLVRTTAREGDLLLLAVVQQLIVDKLTTVVRVQPLERKGQKRAQLLECPQNLLLIVRNQCTTFGPAGGDIGQHEGAQIGAVS